MGRLAKLALAGILVSYSATAKADNFEFNDHISRGESDYHVGKSWVFGPENYSGFDIGISNKGKTSWLELSILRGRDYEEKKDGRTEEYSKSALFPRVSFTPLKACFYNCESKSTALELDARIGTGLFLDLTSKRYPIKIEGPATDFIQVKDEITMSSLDINARWAALVELSARFGFVQARYSLFYNGDINHLVTVGSRF